MNYYYDTEFLEGTQTRRFIGIPVGRTKPTIDLISIGIVSEDDREYYAISKDFNLKEAWNRFQLDEGNGDHRNNPPTKVYWIRENVLKPIFWELCLKEDPYQAHGMYNMWETPWLAFRELKHLIKKHGKSNKKIAKEIVSFVYPAKNNMLIHDNLDLKTLSKIAFAWTEKINLNPTFYTYYGAYDHVALCWLFGKMTDLPKGFPKHTVDLKQIFDEKVRSLPIEVFRKLECGTCSHNPLEFLEKNGEAFNLDFRLKKVKEKHPNYPKQENKHDALSDAKWNKKLHEFIKCIL